MWNLDTTGNPEQLMVRSDAQSSKAAPQSNFWRKCLWSPDGTAAAAVQDDSDIQIFHLSDALLSAWHADGENNQALKEASGDSGLLHLKLRITQSESLYDCVWYPGCEWSQPQTACVAASCRGQPVHLWDALTGRQRSTYRCYDAADELATAHSLAFHPDGEWCADNSSHARYRCLLL
jgi:telomerase Cajal body protein 1